jgi:3-isopropylmalate dehydrogenase
MTINKSIEAIIMATHKLLLLPGDGIGTEVMAEVKRVIAWLNSGIAKFETEDGLVGGSSYDADKVAITDATMARAQAADAVIFGAVGGPKWADVPYDARPEAGLLRLRKDMALFANLRPAIYPALADLVEPQARCRRPRHHDRARTDRRRVFRRAEDHHRSRQRPEARRRYAGLRHLRDRAHHTRRLRTGAQAPQQDDVDGKAQRHEEWRLWKEVVNQVHAREYKDVELEHQLADSGAMQLVRWPKQFDVIVTDNLFGDILSDIAAMLTGSLGMLPSASL